MCGLYSICWNPSIEVNLQIQDFGKVFQYSFICANGEVFERREEGSDFKFNRLVVTASTPWNCSKLFPSFSLKSFIFQITISSRAPLAWNDFEQSVFVFYTPKYKPQ